MLVIFTYGMYQLTEVGIGSFIGRGGSGVDIGDYISKITSGYDPASSDYYPGGDDGGTDGRCGGIRSSKHPLHPVQKARDQAAAADFDATRVAQRFVGLARAVHPRRRGA